MHFSICVYSFDFSLWIPFLHFSGNEFYVKIKAPEKYQLTSSFETSVIGFYSIYQFCL